MTNEEKIFRFKSVTIQVNLMFGAVMSDTEYQKD